MKEVVMAWKGEEKLWKVFWLYNVLLGICFSKAFDFVPEESVSLTLILLALALIWTVWVMVSLWRCSFNTRWKGWGYLARALVITMAAIIIWAGIGAAIK